MRIFGDQGLFCLVALRPASPLVGRAPNLTDAVARAAALPSLWPAGPPPRATHFAVQTRAKLLDIQEAAVVTAGPSVEEADEASGAEPAEGEPTASLSGDGGSGEGGGDLEAGEAYGEFDTASASAVEFPNAPSLDGASATDGDGDASQEGAAVAEDDSPRGDGAWASPLPAAGLSVDTRV